MQTPPLYSDKVQRKAFVRVRKRGAITWGASDLLKKNVNVFLVYVLPLKTTWQQYWLNAQKVLMSDLGQSIASDVELATTIRLPKQSGFDVDGWFR